MEGPLIAARKTLTRSARPSCKLPFHPGQPRGDVRQHHQTDAVVQEVCERTGQGIRFTTHVEGK